MLARRQSATQRSAGEDVHGGQTIVDDVGAIQKLALNGNAYGCPVIAMQ